MTLDDHLKAAGCNNAEFGRLVLASEATISRLRNNKQAPSLALMRRIATATKGAVTPNDFSACAPAVTEAAA